MLTFEEAKELFTYNRETGVIKWRKRMVGGGQHGNLVAGGASSSDGYARVCFKGKKYLVHRIAMLLAYGFYGDELEVDHINHVRDDNRLVNLRFATRTDNGRNLSISSRNATGVTGVYYHKRSRKYMARITVDRVIIYLGIFSTLEGATKARKDADIKYKFNANHGTNKAMYVRSKRIYKP